MRLAFLWLPGFPAFPKVCMLFFCLTLARLCGKLLEIIMLDIREDESRRAGEPGSRVVVALSVCTY